MERTKVQDILIQLPSCFSKAELVSPRYGERGYRSFSIVFRKPK